MKVMFKALKEKGVAFYPNTKALDLVLKNGVVTGVKVRSGNEEFVIPTKNVILATGGFAHNQKLVKKFAPEWANCQLQQPWDRPETAWKWLLSTAPRLPTRMLCV